MAKYTSADPGIYNKQLHARLASSPIYASSLALHTSESKGKFVYSYAVDTLGKLLAELSEEKVNSAFLSGRYNPYVRDYPFPPVKFNFNYLLDPRAVLYGLTYERLYDEHKEGFITNRASPLLIKGMRIIR